MGILEKITQMKKQGVGDEEIVGTLQQGGISPKEINEALSQSQIKSAVGGPQKTEEMESSIMEQTPPSPQPTQEGYAPKTQEISEQEMYAPQSEYAQQEYYPEEGYEDYSQEGTNTDTMIEIAEQVFSEKMKKITKQLADLNEFKTLAQVKIENSVERLKRIETIIDKLQISIIEKVGSYGQNLNSIKKEMSMMQDSFGKVVNQAVRKNHIVHQTHPKKISKK
ncbi:hypothetical protein KAR52_03305 [Candidatus Pacearchaeota archaeon]|nr:hypothetical protein [Candidatus Pacearchaeota archaeon]